MVAHSKRQDALVDADAACVEEEVWRVLVHGFDDELALRITDVPDIAPREADLRCDPGRQGQVKQRLQVRLQSLIALPPHSSLLRFH